MRGEREGYVVECCVSNVERVSDAVVLKWVALLGGNDEWRRTESMGGEFDAARDADVSIQSTDWGASWLT